MPRTPSSLCSPAGGAAGSPTPPAPVSTSVQAHERTIVALADDAHERSITHIHAVDRCISEVRNREADRVDAHALVTFPVESVQAIDGVDDALYGAAGEVVAEHVDADLLVGRPEVRDRDLDTLDGARVAERRPAPRTLDDGLAAGRRVVHPLAGVVREHVVALVVHHLHALHRRIDVERLVQGAQHEIPVEVLHAAGRVDDEDDVLAVDRDAADGLVDAALESRAEALHLLRQALLRGRETALEDVRDRRVLRRGRVAVLEVAEPRAQMRELVALGRQDFRLARELAIQDLALAADGEELLLELRDDAVELLLRVLEGAHVARLRHDDEQDDGAEAAADDVQEGEAERLDLAALGARPRLAHGQSFAGLIMDPEVFCASCQ